MRILMLGTGPFAVPTLAALLDAGHDVPALVTRPTPPAKGREKTPFNPMRDLAESRSIPVLAPDSINTPQSRQQLANLRPELLVVCDYGQILSDETLSAAPLGGINLHGSLLPKYRGAAPVHWAIWNGETQTGVTVIHMTSRLDGGPILAIRKTPIDPDETTPELELRLSQLGVEAIHEAITRLQAWDGRSPIGERQDTKMASKAPRLTKQHGAVDWSQSAQRIRNQVRALKPWPGTYTYWLRAQGEPLRVILDKVQSAECGVRNEPGQVILSDGERLVVATGTGALAIQRLQPAGKRVMDASEFLRGYPLKAGERLGPA
ncbi:MAG TPA: methionyl-tRNA formyltransferase [Pirellulaceae bacterium]|nr:methionyl-tRNA formyltransferase [Pirellulaceae bacterium]